MPIPDGVYLTAEHCALFQKRELDFLALEVSKNGREYTLPETGCLVASVRKLRQKRYLIEGDCIEAGDAWQHTFMIDVLDGQKIRMDGTDLQACPLEAAASPKKRPSASGQKNVNPADFIEEWHNDNENCRGGSGDDFSTMKACDRRDAVARDLTALNWCYGRKMQPASKYEWHKCDKHSIRD